MDHADLFNHDAVKKLQELTRNAGTAFLQTHLENIPCSGRPMIIAHADEAGRLWFFSKASSSKNAEIQQNSQVQVICARPHCSEFLCLYGTASIIRDRGKIRELWVSGLRLWFESCEDPEITLICVKPVDAYYWDSTHNSAAMLIKNVVGALTGAALNGNIEGKLLVEEGGKSL